METTTWRKVSCALKQVKVSCLQKLLDELKSFYCGSLRGSHFCETCLSGWLTICFIVLFIAKARHFSPWRAHYTPSDLHWVIYLFPMLLLLCILCLRPPFFDRAEVDLSWWPGGQPLDLNSLHKTLIESQTLQPVQTGWEEGQASMVWRG